MAADELVKFSVVKIKYFSTLIKKLHYSFHVYYQLIHSIVLNEVINILLCSLSLLLFLSCWWSHVSLHASLMCHVMSCDVMSCYKLLQTFHWLVIKSLVIFWAQKSPTIIKLERLHKQCIAPIDNYMRLALMIANRFQPMVCCPSNCCQFYCCYGNWTVNTAL